MHPHLCSDHYAQLQAIVTRDEIKRTLFDIKSNKAPGLDGFPTNFFKRAWPVVGKDFIYVIKGFFNSGKLLKSVDATIISVVP